jgi:hypothetical protein
MKRLTNRLFLLAIATAAIVSCDTRLPTATRRAGPGSPPTVDLQNPVANDQINLGDSILAIAQVTGGNGLKTLVFSADAQSGDVNLGTFQLTPRYATVSVTFPPGTIDTTIRRYLRVLNPADQNLDSLVIRAVVTDSLGLVDTAFVRATIVSGPHVTIDSPANGDSVPSGVAISILAHATDVDGIGRITIRVDGDPSWPVPMHDTLIVAYDGTSRDVILNGVFNIPATAPQRSRITVNASALDAVRQPGTAVPITLFIRSNASIPAPRVTQTVGPRSELGDTVKIVATGQGIVSVGLIVRDSVGNILHADTVALPPPITSNVQVGVPLKLSLADQGRHLAITAFAIDQIGRIGYAVRPTFIGSETVLLNAVADSTEVVYGQTFTMPIAGIVGDVAVDTLRGNVFLSNKSHNRLEVWSNTTRTFNPAGITVGSEPWGMTVTAKSPDSLLVANSGGTNISKVCIANCAGGSMLEDLPNRMLTRNVYLFQMFETIDGSCFGGLCLSISDPISYSDRPQYIAQSVTGRIYFSTLPTPHNGAGTIRWLDPDKGPAPDPHFVWQYAEGNTGNALDFTIFNVDSITVRPLDPNNTLALADGIFMFDHLPGKTSGYICAAALDSLDVLPPAPDPRSQCVRSTRNGVPGAPNDRSIEALTETLKRQGSDVDKRLRLNLGSLELTDTTFVASSFDRRWIAFGEGHSGGVGRIMLALDSLPQAADSNPQFFSPHVTVADLTDNASERVFGLALDRRGQTVASHGSQSYFAAVDNPFHLRLQGKFDSFDDGAGIALHPQADGANSLPDTRRLAFVGSASGRIEIVDIAHYNSRGTLPLKYPIYGPLRASMPMPGDDPSIVLKLFAVTTRGLIVIDLTAGDIKIPPP